MGIRHTLGKGCGSTSLPTDDGGGGGDSDGCTGEGCGSSNTLGGEREFTGEDEADLGCADDRSIFMKESSISFHKHLSFTLNEITSLSVR